MDISKLRVDPRCYQIAVLATLTAWGYFALGFAIRWQNALAIVAVAELVQWFAGRIVGLPRFDPLSAAITSLSLTLLLRTNALDVAMLAAGIAIGSKFLLRVSGKHVFNPANLALVTTVLVTDRAWISPGQWGSAAISAFALACLGTLVLTRARRAETTLAFLGAYALLIFGRSAWLGDPLAIPLHQLQNGALLLFAFFMISDPKTTPDARAGRIAFGVLVATTAWIIQFVFHTPNAPVFALILAAPLVPAIDLLARGRNYQWSNPAALPAGHLEGADSCES